MKIYTKLVLQWNEGADKYLPVVEESYEYDGPVALCCGATGAQNTIQTGQMNAYTQMNQQAQAVFGQDSQVFNQLQSTFAPTVAAGPSQQGFSPTENANLQSQAITESGQAYKSAKSAVGEAVAAQGGGNNAALTSGTNTGIDINVADSAAANTANQLGQITQANYQTGRQNYDTAVAGLAGSTNVFNSATNAGNAATGAGSAASTTANQIATQNNSWIQSVTGALGGVAGAAVGDIGSGGGGGGALQNLQSIASNASPVATQDADTSNMWVTSD